LLPNPFDDEMITGLPANGVVRGINSDRSRTVITGIALANVGSAKPAAAAAPVPRNSRRETDIVTSIRREMSNG
jgi:hypothetical protein